jgi:hypothetical protein
MLGHIPVLRTELSEEHIASIIRVERVKDVQTTLTLPSVLQFIVTANVVPSSLILVTLMMEAIRSSEPSVLTRATVSHTPEVGILHSRRRENIITKIRND